MHVHASQDVPTSYGVDVHSESYEYSVRHVDQVRTGEAGGRMLTVPLLTGQRLRRSGD